MSYADHIKSIADFYQNKKETPFNPEKPYYYVVPMFPYPSGKIHMGHIRNYTISNAVTQYKKSQGLQVFHPIGFDSFGMPAENAAIKNKVAPQEWTEQNIAQMTADFKKSGFDFNWDHTINTHEFDYYKFEQDIFKKAWIEGIIYKKNQYVNYDPVDKTVLSNEQVHNGLGWRTGAKVIRKKIPMYFFNMKAYAQRLHDGLDTLVDWPKKVIEMQRHWINIEKGMNIHYQFKDTTNDLIVFKPAKQIEINSIIVGINNPWVSNWDISDSFKQWIAQNSEGGVSQKENYSKKIYFNTDQTVEYNDKIIPVVIDMNGDDECRFSSNIIETTGNQNIIVGKFIKEEEFTFIGLKDWCISRQRYWGNPIPVINCSDCGDNVNSEYIKLPEHLIPDGSGNILNHDENYINCSCPNCGKPAQRCTDTMDTFVQSSWYFHRYIAPQSETMIKYPDTQIDHYIGGVEHATMHLIYTRFFHKMLHDFGMVSTQEPIRKLTTQGMVCKKYTKEDGTIASSKMSKNIGNIVEPNEYIEKYGSDAVQMFMIFAAPPNQNFDFDDAGIIGTYRFLDEVYRYFFEENNAHKNQEQHKTYEIMQKMDSYIQKEFDGRFNLNTIVPQIMVAFKAMKKTVFTDTFIKNEVEKIFVKNIGIVAPQLTYFINENIFKPTIVNKVKI